MSGPGLDRLLGVLPEPGLVVEGTGAVRSANRAAGELFGRPARSLVGADLASLLVDDAGAVHEYLRRAAASTDPSPGALSVALAGGETLPCRATAGCLRPWSPEEPPLLYVRLQAHEVQSSRFILLNEKIAELTGEVKRRVRLEEERAELLAAERRSRAAAEEAIRVKDEFLAVVSHELRTPLHTLLVWAGLLKQWHGRDELEGADPEGLARGVGAIDRAARQLGDLVGELLDLSLLEGGETRLRLREVDLASLVREVAEGAASTAELKGVELAVDILPESAPVRGDPARLRQVVWHLISNAIKFTPGGGRVDVALESQGEDGFRLTVTDTGVGIPEDVLPHVFDRFRQAGAVRRRGSRGLGLGLSIVRHLVELHGGAVTAESEGTGLGSSFTLVLPRGREDGQEIEAA